MRFEIEPRSNMLHEVRFDVTEFAEYKTWAQQPHNGEQVANTFLQISKMLSACMSNGIPLKQIDVSVERVFFDPWFQSVRFVCLPWAGVSVNIEAIQSFFQSLVSLINPIDADAASLKSKCLQYFSDCNRFDSVGLSSYLHDAAESYLSSRLSAKTKPSKEISQPLYRGTTVLSKVSNTDALAGRPVLDALTGVLADEEDNSENNLDVEQTRNVCSPQSEYSEKSAYGDWSDYPETGVLNGVDFSSLPVDLRPDESIKTPVMSTDSFTKSSEVSDMDDSLTKLPADGDLCNQISDGISLGSLEESECETGLLVPEQPKPKYCLLHNKTKQCCEITGRRFVIGKSKYSSFQVKNTKTVSRSHAIFSVDDEGCWIEDDDSLNGTFINEQSLSAHQRVKLADGDSVRMSDELFTFQVLLASNGE